SHGAGKAEVVHLNRRWAKSKNAGPRTSLVTLQVDSDVYSKVIKKLRDIVVAHCRHVEKLMGSGYDARAYFAAVIRTERDRNHFKWGAMVQLEQSGQEVRRRMTMKIGRNIRKPDLVAAPDRPPP